MQRRCFLLAGIGVVLTGCGGGGGGTVSIATRISVRWGARSRATTIGSSALSLVIALRPALGGSDHQFFVDRPTNTITEQTETYIAPFSLAPGDYQLTLTAYAVAGGGGSVVARGTQSITLGSEGLLPDVGLMSTVGTVAIPAGQSLSIGERRSLRVDVLGKTGEALVLTEGSLFWEVLSGEGRVRVEEGLLVGVAPGTASIRVVIDSVSSPAATVSIVSGVSVKVLPQSVKLTVDGSQTFTAQVQGAPEGQTGVVWSLREGDVAGTIDSAGNYRALGATGVYHVVATSIYDPSRFGEAEIQVEGGSLQVGVRWEETGGLGVGVR